MFSTSTQLKYWTFSSEKEIRQLRQEANQNFVQAHGKNMTDQERAAFFLSPTEERLLLRQYEYVLKEFCSKFNPPLPKCILGTSLAFFKRFWINISPMDYHPKDIMLTAVYLACKVEEFYVPISQFVSNLKGNREKFADTVLTFELLLMSKLRYHLTVHNPFRALEGLLIDVKTRFPDLENAERLRKNYDEFLDRALMTDIVLIFSPSQLALASMMYSAGKETVNLDRYVVEFLTGGCEQEDLKKLIFQLKRIKHMVKTDQMIPREQIPAIQKKLERCRNQENNPESDVYKARLAERLEEEDEQKSHKRARIQEKSSRKSEDLTKERQRRKEHSISWPPGKWRLGIPWKKARYLFMRFATKDDQKELGAEKKSHYYRKYGNPNYGGMKGLISTSRKRKILFAKRDKEVKSQGPDAREAIDKKRADRKRQQVKGQDREEGELSNEEPMGREEEEEEEEEEPVSEEEEAEIAVAERPKDLRQLLDRDTDKAQASRKRGAADSRGLDKVVVKQRPPQPAAEGSEEELDLDAELEQLLEPSRPPPPKKRMMMRMHADEEEERIKARRSHTGRGLLTVVASSRETGVQSSRMTSRLGGRLQLPASRQQQLQQRSRTGNSNDRRRDGGQAWSSEARPLHSEDDEDEEEEDAAEEEVVEEMDDFARELNEYRSLRNLPPLKPRPVSTAPAAAAAAAAAAPKVRGKKSSLVSDSSPAEGAGDGGDLRSRLGRGGGGKKAGGKKEEEKRNFPSMRIEVFDDDDDDQ